MIITYHVLHKHLPPSSSPALFHKFLYSLSFEDLEAVTWHVEIGGHNLALFELEFSGGDGARVQSGDHFESGLRDEGIHTHLARHFDGRAVR